MPAVDLWECSRCLLRWVESGLPDNCPSCRQQHSIPQGPIIVAGRDVREGVVRSYGLKEGMASKDVRRGLDRLNLGLCEHGYMLGLMCRDCTPQQPIFIGALTK